MKMMKEQDIPAFVEDVSAAGCDITAVLGVGYVIGDADLSEEDYALAAPKLADVAKKYGSRDHLFSQICDYLISIGRCYPPTTVH